MPGLMYNVIKSPDELKPHPENVKIYGNEATDNDLSASIKEKGVLEPIVIKDDNTILSGHRRWQAAKAAGLDKIPCRTISFNDNLDEMESLIEFNRQREKTFTQRMKEGEALKEIVSERAKRRQQATQNNNTAKAVSATLRQQDKEEQGKTTNIVAEKIGMKARTYEKAAKVWDKAKEGDIKAKEILEKVDKGTISINKAYNEIKKQEKQEQKETVIKQIEEHKETETEETKPELCIDNIENGWYKVGNQFLYVGSNLDSEFIDFVPRCRMAFADPPYNAGVAEWDNDFEWKQDYLQDKAEIVAVTPGGWNAYGFYNQTKMNYVWEMCCWIKNGMTHGKCGYANFIKTSIFSKGKVKIQQDLWTITIKTGETGETSHKGRKPYDFMYYIIDMFTEKGDNIIDPFAGSGTTLLTSEYMERISYNAEIDKEHCLHIIQRAVERGMEYEQL